MTTQLLGRRRFLAGAATLAGLTLSACSTTSGTMTSLAANDTVPIAPELLKEMYGPRPNEKFPIPAAPISHLDPKFYRQIVDDPTGERPGTVVINTADRFLYLVRENGRAMRYGVGIGRQGFSWDGRGVIAYKKEWPTWTPPAEMIVREPELEEWRYGMPPSLDNPLGARALYIFQDGKDTLYRLHGNRDVNSIGKAVSSGCIRLLYQDVIDLYGRVPDGSPILVV